MTDSKKTSSSKPRPNYSELPQKPISLKKGIGGLARPKSRQETSGEKKPPQPPATPQKRKPVTQKKSTGSGQWTLRGISPDVRELAVKSAREEGIKLSEWMEQAIHHAAAPVRELDEERDDEAVMQTLQEIREQLDRIEDKSGLLYRAWERVKLWFG